MNAFLKPSLLLAAFTGCLGSSVYARSWHTNSSPTPFDAHNGNPFVVLTAPPSWLSSGLPEQVHADVSLQHALSNSFRENEAGDEISSFDSETGLTTLSARFRLTNTLESYIRIPWITQSAGQLDSLIYHWHDAFGLPQGRRTDETNNQFQLRYWDAGQAKVARTGPSRELGDIRLGLTMPLTSLGVDAMLQSELRLPTGDADALAGTGASGASLGLGATTQSEWLGVSTGWFGTIGLTWNDAGDGPLAYRQKAIMLSGRAGAQWQWFPTCLIKMQLDSHSSAYDSELKELGGIPLQLTAGVTFGLTEYWWGDFSLSEDLNAGASPDLTVAFRVNYLWNRN
ncbi:MAG: DUF3187 family protein [Hahellaceae bacterium]|nr:DUF3187 family protein [Hahellaceae bacterium]